MFFFIICKIELIISSLLIYKDEREKLTRISWKWGNYRGETYRKAESERGKHTHWGGSLRRDRKRNTHTPKAES